MTDAPPATCWRAWRWCRARWSAGLDASPPVRAKLAEAGDAAAAAIIDIILRDEVGHVAIGNHWYRWLCAQRGLEPVATYAQLAAVPRAEAARPVQSRSPARGRFRRGRTGLADGLGWLAGPSARALFHQPQHAALDLAGGRHRQLVDEFDRLRVLVRRQLAAHMLLQFATAPRRYRTTARRTASAR
jgi:hypothetical protein